jgi:hypothetical protein
LRGNPRWELDSKLNDELCLRGKDRQTVSSNRCLDPIVEFLQMRRAVIVDRDQAVRKAGPVPQVTAQIAL